MHTYIPLNMQVTVYMHEHVHSDTYGTEDIQISKRVMYSHTCVHKHPYIHLHVHV